MPTYTYRCTQCDTLVNTMMSISEYSAHPPVFVHCGKHMERKLSASNLMVSERHYEGLRAPDGTDISSKAKHRAYMRQRGLTTVDDFAGVWRREAQQRDERLAGVDPQRAQDVADSIVKLGG